MKKLAFIWNFSKATEIWDYYRDGLRAALEVISEDTEVDIFLGESYKEIKDEFDAILIWGDSNEMTIDHFVDFKGQKGLILTTMPDNKDNLKKYDVIFCESQPVYQAVRNLGLHAVHAFGTDTDFFSPDYTIKDIPYFYPATFSPWKGQSNIAYLGDALYCVGTIQPDGVEELQLCIDKGVRIEVGYFKAIHIRDLYKRTQRVIIPAIHGSERTVLEAMSMDILPAIVYPDINRKAYSFIQEYNDTLKLTPRDFVLKNYNHKLYAQKIKKGLKIYA